MQRAAGPKQLFNLPAREKTLEGGFGNVIFRSLLLSPEYVSRTAQRRIRRIARTFMVIQKIRKTGGKNQDG
jgi:hypothetical protein